MKNCINCGKEIVSDSLFCSYCSSKQPAAEVHTSLTETECAKKTVEVTETITPIATTTKVKKGARIASIVRNSIIMALATFLLIASFFPINTMNLEDNYMIGNRLGFDDADVTLGFNAFQYITLFFDSLKDVDGVDEISDLYETVEEMSKEFNDFDDDDFKNLTSKEKRLIKKIFYITARTVTQLDKGDPSVSLVFSAIFGMVNILLSVALFVVGLLNLLATFNVIKRGKAHLYKWTVALIAASPAVILAACYVGHLYTGGNMSVMAILSVICVAIVVVLSMVLRYIFSKRDTVKNIIARSVALALSVVVFCLAFAPVFSVTFKSTMIGSERLKSVKVTHGAEFFEALAISDDESEKFDDVSDMSKGEKKKYFESMMNAFSLMSKKDIQSDYGARLNSEILVYLLGSKIHTPVLNLFSTTVVFFLLTVIGALLILWQSVYFFATGKHIKPVVIVSKICAAVAAMVALIMTIILVVVTASYAEDYISSSYDIAIGAGVIMMVVFSIGSIFCPVSLTKKVKKVRRISVEDACKKFEEQF